MPTADVFAQKPALKPLVRSANPGQDALGVTFTTVELPLNAWASVKVLSMVVVRVGVFAGPLNDQKPTRLFSLPV